MPSPPYARLGIRVAAGAPQYGGLSIAHGASIQLVAESTAFWSSPAAVWQIYDYPDGWTGPGAPWISLSVAQPNGLPDAVVYQYTGNTFPPAFTLPALPYWGKFGCSLRVNNGSELSDLYDESTGFQILSPRGLMEPGFRETSQFGSWRAWAGVLKLIVRTIDALAAGFASVSSATPQPVGTAAAGVGTAASRDDHVHAHGNQLGGLLHANAVAAGAAGFMAGADKTKLDAATDAATASAIVLRDASARAKFADPAAAADAATMGYVDSNRVKRVYDTTVSISVTQADGWTVVGTLSPITAVTTDRIIASASLFLDVGGVSGGARIVVNGGPYTDEVIAERTFAPDAIGKMVDMFGRCALTSAATYTVTLQILSTGVIGNEVSSTLSFDAFMVTVIGG